MSTSTPLRGRRGKKTGDVMSLPEAVRSLVSRGPVVTRVTERTVTSEVEEDTG